MWTRRRFLRAAALAPFAAPLAGSGNRFAALPSAQMRLALHQNTSRAAGFRGSLEGWARAGIRHVELSDSALDGFLRTESIAAARSLLGDLGLTPVSAAAVLQDLWVPGPARVQTLEAWRRRCDQFAALGLEKIYSPSITTRRVTRDEESAAPACIREAGEIARAAGLVAMIEFTRTSTHLATLAATLDAIRTAAHPNVRPMLDLFHFWSGSGRIEDLDLLEPGELAHVHFQDTMDVPRESIDNGARAMPGDGVAPLVQLLRKLDEKGYAGALSVELIQGDVVRRDAFEAATEIREKAEAVMRAAGVLGPTGERL